MENTQTPRSKMLTIVRNSSVAVLASILIDFFFGFLLSNSVITYDMFRFGIYFVWTVLVIVVIWTVAYKTTKAKQNSSQPTQSNGNKNN